MKRRPPNGLAAAAFLCAVLLMSLAGCGGPEAAAPGAATGHGDGHALYPKLPAVTGHIDGVEANPDNPRYFSRLSITDADGRQWAFRSDGWVGVSVGHLKDHQIQGTAVTVWYENRGDSPFLARFVGD